MTLRHADPDTTIQLRRQPVAATTYISQSRQPRVRNVSAMVLWSAVLTAFGIAATALAIAVEVSTGYPMVSSQAVRIFVTAAAVSGVGIIVGLARDAMLKAISEARANHERILAKQAELYERVDRRISDIEAGLDRRIADLEVGVDRLATSLGDLRAHMSDLLELREADIELHAMRKVSGDHWVITPRPGSNGARLRPVD